MVLFLNSAGLSMPWLNACAGSRFARSSRRRRAYVFPRLAGYFSLTRLCCARGGRRVGAVSLDACPTRSPGRPLPGVLKDLARPGAEVSPSQSSVGPESVLSRSSRVYARLMYVQRLWVYEPSYDLTISMQYLYSDV
jgi:hypothetical protein